MLILPITSWEAFADSDKTEVLPLVGKTEKLSFTTNEGSWLSLDITPNGKTIIFDLLGDLYHMPVTGGNAEPLTSGLGYDSQPKISPDGQWITFISDRNGADNVWITKLDGTEPRKISNERQSALISPTWTPDSNYVIVTRSGVEKEFVMYHIDGGSGVTLSGTEEENEFWGVGAEVSPDGQYMYFAKQTDSNGPVKNFPTAQINRYGFLTGNLDQITQGEGGGLRPALSSDGEFLVYATRNETKTGLRIRNLSSGSDRWLSYPVQRDAQENFRPPSRDLLPGYSFTPDDQSIIFHAGGKFHRVDITSNRKQEIPFSANVNLDIGPDLTASYRVPQDEITSTIIHNPSVSPDGKKIVASALSSIYTMQKEKGKVEKLTDSNNWEFQPVWSPDGRWITYVTWSMNEGGHIWRTRSNGRGKPQKLTDTPAFYTDVVYAPDGKNLFAMQGNEYMRHQTFSEFTGLGIPLELITLPADGGKSSVIMSANNARNPHFGKEKDRIYLYDGKLLFSVKIDGINKRDELTVTGPKGNRRNKEPLNAERIIISPDGKNALALVNKQVWLIPMAKTGSAAPTVDINKGSLPTIRLTDIGADFFGWAHNGTSIYWSIGKTLYERSLDSIELHAKNKESEENNEEQEAFVALEENTAVHRSNFDVVLPRNIPSGSILLRGANVIPMSREMILETSLVMENQDILVTRNRIVKIANSGSLDIDRNTKIIDVNGKFIIPGFIDTHAHWEFRTGDVLEPHNWTLTANLAYGVTSGLDVQTSTKDYFAYRDFQSTGQSIGQRAFMTGPGIFGFNDFQSYDATLSYLKRYSDHYNTKNIKSYLVGNRQQRQWVVIASKELNLMPTTEGGGDQKLDITHAIDGMHGNEHTLPDSPIFSDVVELYAKTQTAYTPTLVVQYNANSLREYFFTRTEVHDDKKLQRFYPHNRLDELTQRRPGWIRDEEFQFREAAAQAAKIQRAGGLVGVGGHAELQGLGYHWEMWAFVMGGMLPAEALRAATIDGARIIGIDEDLGSVESGKLADLVILNKNPLEDIRNSTAIYQVMQDGRLYDGETLDQIWPKTQPLKPFWWWDDEDVRFSSMATPQ